MSRKGQETHIKHFTFGYYVKISTDYFK